MKRSPIDLAARVAAPTVVADLALVDGGMPSAHQGRPYSYQPSNTSASARDTQPSYSADPYVSKYSDARPTTYAYTPKPSSSSARDSQPSQPFFSSRY
jgi:hypothetical protein